MLEHLSAVKRLADKLRSLHELEAAISGEIVKQDYAAAERFAWIARKHAVEALEAALGCVALALNQRGHIPMDGIRNAEQLLMITPGTFSSFFAVTPESGGRGRAKALGELLVEARDRIDSTPVDIRGSHTSPLWLPAVFGCVPRFSSVRRWGLRWARLPSASRLSRRSSRPVSR